MEALMENKTAKRTAALLLTTSLFYVPALWAKLPPETEIEMESTSPSQNRTAQSESSSGIAISTSSRVLTNLGEPLGIILAFLPPREWLQLTNGLNSAFRNDRPRRLETAINLINTREGRIGLLSHAYVSRLLRQSENTALTPLRAAIQSLSAHRTFAEIRSENRPIIAFFAAFDVHPSPGHHDIYVHTPNYKIAPPLGVSPLVLFPPQDLANMVCYGDAREISSIPPEEIPILTPEQIYALGESQIKNLTGEQIKNLTPRQLRTLTWKQIKALLPETIRELTPQQLQVFSQEQGAAFESHQFRDLSISQLSDMHCIPHWLIRNIPPEHFRTHSPAILGRLSENSMDYLTRNQLQSLSLEQVGGFSPAQAGQLSRLQLHRLEWRIQGFGEASTRALRLDFIDWRIWGLTAEQVGWLEPRQVLSLTQEQLDTFTEQQFRAFAPHYQQFTGTQIGGLTLTQLQRLPAEMLFGLHTNSLRALDVWNISRENARLLWQQRRGDLTRRQLVVLGARVGAHSFLNTLCCKNHMHREVSQ